MPKQEFKCEWPQCNTIVLETIKHDKDGNVLSTHITITGNKLCKKHLNEFNKKYLKDIHKVMGETIQKGINEIKENAIKKMSGI